MDIRNPFSPFSLNQSSFDRSAQAQSADSQMLKAAPDGDRQSMLLHGSAQIESQEDTAARLAAQLNKFGRELTESMAEYGKVSSRAEKSFIDSYKGFESFKEKMLSEQPDMNLEDLEDLDVRLEDGKLRLSSETLSDKQLSSLEKQLTDDEELTQTLTSMLTDMTVLARFHPGQDERPAFKIDPEYNVEEGVMSLNELVGAYNQSFERFHENSYTLSSDKQLSGADRFEPVLDHYQTFESRYQRDGLSRFAWFDLVDRSVDRDSGSAINARA